jgi:hypothetical protein
LVASGLAIDFDDQVRDEKILRIAGSQAHRARDRGEGGQHTLWQFRMQRN